MQYTRLVLLTVEVVAAAQLRCAKALNAPSLATPPTGYVQAFLPPFQQLASALPAQPPAIRIASLEPSQSLGLTAAASTPSTPSTRSTDEAGGASNDSDGSAAASASCPPCFATRTLVCFNGAALGSTYCTQQLVQLVAEAYARGWTAAQLVDSVSDVSFVQSGGLLPVGLPSEQYAGPEINRQLFSTWISFIYIAMAQLGVPHKLAARDSGWAWAAPAGDEVRGARPAGSSHARLCSACAVLVGPLGCACHLRLG